MKTTATVIFVAAAIIAVIAAATRSEAQPEPRPAQRAAADAGSEPAGDPPIVVRTWLSQTALWVGDHITFTVEVISPPTINLLSEDFAKEKLTVEGLEVLQADSDRSVDASGHVIQRYRYVLTSYQTESTLKIADWVVRYATLGAGGRVEDSVAAGELKIPGAVVALRSTLPDTLPSMAARDRGDLQPVPAALRLARPVGIVLMLVSVVPVAIWAGSWLRLIGPRIRRRTLRSVRKHARTALDELELMDVSNDDQRRDAYTQLNVIMRQHLSQVTGLPAHALTPDEIAKRLGPDSTALDSIETVLADCERARYEPPHRLPSAERFRESLAAAVQAVAASR